MACGSCSRARTRPPSNITLHVYLASITQNLGAPNTRLVAPLLEEAEHRRRDSATDGAGRVEEVLLLDEGRVEVLVHCG